MQTTKISVLVCALAFSAAATIRAVDTPAQAAARAAVAAKLLEMDAETPPWTNTAAKPAPVASAEKTAVGDTPAQAAARAAVAAKLLELDAETPPWTNTAAKPAAVTPAEKTVVMTPVNGETKAQKEAAKKAAAKAALAASATPEMKPIMAPASPLSATKEQRLQDLLVKYKADQVSPEEYQRQRAAILAEP